MGGADQLTLKGCGGKLQNAPHPTHWNIMLTELCYKIASLPSDQSTYTGVRKVVQGVTFETASLPPVNLTQLGYRGVGDAKIKQLMRNYWNQDHIDAARTKLEVRRGSAHTAVAVSCEGEKKSTKSQGFCLRSVIITQTPKKLEADVIYRSTEVIQKFTADLVLLSKIFEALEVNPQRIRFYFANAFLSALYFPSLFQNVDPIHYLEYLKAHDARFYRTALNAFAKFLETECRYGYRQRVYQYQVAQSLDLDKLNDYCKLNGASFISRETA